MKRRTLLIGVGCAVVIAVVVAVLAATGTSSRSRVGRKTPAPDAATKIVTDTSDLLRVRVPSTWRVTKRSKSHIEVTAPRYDQNIIATSEPVGVSSRGYAVEQDRLLRQELKGYVEKRFAPARIFGGRAGYLREFSWSGDGDPVDQVQVYYAVADRGYVATATRRSAPDSFSLLRALIARLELDL